MQRPDTPLNLSMLYGHGQQNVRVLKKKVFINELSLGNDFYHSSFLSKSHCTPTALEIRLYVQSVRQFRIPVISGAVLHHSFFVSVQNTCYQTVKWGNEEGHPFKLRK